MFINDQVIFSTFLDLTMTSFCKLSAFLFSSLHLCCISPSLITNSGQTTCMFLTTSPIYTATENFVVHNYLSIRWILEQGVGNYRSINRLLIEAKSQKPFSLKSDNDKTEIIVFDSWLIVLNYFTYIIIGTPILKIDKILVPWKHKITRNMGWQKLWRSLRL